MKKTKKNQDVWTALRMIDNGSGNWKLLRVGKRVRMDVLSPKRDVRKRESCVLAKF